MFKNVATKLRVYAFDSTTNLPKDGDAANLTAYVSKDYGAVTVLADTTAVEEDATNAKGFYLFDLAQAETNADALSFSAKSSTANIVVLAMPATVFTLPATGILAPTTAGRTLDVTAGGEAGIDLDNASGALGTSQFDADFLTAALIAPGAIDADAIAADAVTEIQSGLATAAALDTVDNFLDTEIAALTTELAKVPKSDSNVTWNATALASIQSEANDALVANRLVPAASGTVNDVSPTTDNFDTTLTDDVDFWNDCRIEFTSGVLNEQSRVISAYSNVNGNITLDEVLTSAPANGDSFVIWASHTHTKSQITSDVWANGTRTLTAGTNIVLAKGTGITGFNDLSAAQVNAEVDQALADYDGPTNAEFEARTLVAAGYATPTNITAGTITTVTNLTNAPTVGDLTAAMKASVNTEVLDVLNVDTFAELVADPGASPTIVKALMLLYMALRDKLDITATAKKIHNNAGTVVFTKTLSDDGTTYSESKIA